MPQLSAATSLALAHDREPRPVYEVLYKVDRPRAVDRYIDFFGDGTPRAEVDAGGDIVLSSLA